MFVARESFELGSERIDYFTNSSRLKNKMLMESSIWLMNQIYKALLKDKGPGKEVEPEGEAEEALWVDQVKGSQHLDQSSRQ